MYTSVKGIRRLSGILSSHSTLAICLLAVVPSAVHAQSQTDDPAAPPANPQTAPSDPTQAPEIIVTGTSIKGAAPVGSHLIQVDQQQIRDSGVQNTADLLATIPQLGSFGTTPRVGSDSANPVNPPSLRGLSGSATLSLVNGHRLVSLGSVGTASDPTSIPLAAIERVEVLTDGASSTYGSDAVAGVINVILRKDLNGLDIQANYGLADGYAQRTISAVAGKTWSSGSFMIAGQYFSNSALMGYERSYVRDDLICPPLSGPETMIVWTTKGTMNAEQEAQAGRDYRQAA